MAANPQTPFHILLVEDEALIAFAVEDILTDLGCEVVGPAFRLDDAVGLASAAPIDAAILDVNLNDQRSYAVADELKRRGILARYSDRIESMYADA